MAVITGLRPFKKVWINRFKNPQPSQFGNSDLKNDFRARSRFGKRIYQSLSTQPYTDVGVTAAHDFHFNKQTLITVFDV